MTHGRTNISAPYIKVPRSGYLYNCGDECEELSGGWSTSLSNLSKGFDGTASLSKGGTTSKNADNLQMNLVPEGSMYKYTSVSTASTISVDGYETLNILYDVIEKVKTHESDKLLLCLFPQVEGNIDPTSCIASMSISEEVGTGYVASLDISKVGTTEVAVVIVNYVGNNGDAKYSVKIYEVWLE